MIVVFITYMYISILNEYLSYTLDVFVMSNNVFVSFCPFVYFVICLSMFIQSLTMLTPDRHA